MHICVGKLTIIGSDNSLSPGRRQVIIWTDAVILLVGPIRTHFVEILIGIKTTRPYESHFFYLTKKRHVQTQARQDKAWQGMAWQGKARGGQTRQDEAAPRQEGVPWFWKILYTVDQSSVCNYSQQIKAETNGHHGHFQSYFLLWIT